VKKWERTEGKAGGAGRKVRAPGVGGRGVFPDAAPSCLPLAGLADSARWRNDWSAAARRGHTLSPVCCWAIAERKAQMKGSQTPRHPLGYRSLTSRPRLQRTNPVEPPAGGEAADWQRLNQPASTEAGPSERAAGVLRGPLPQASEQR